LLTALRPLRKLRTWQELFVVVVVFVFVVVVVVVVVVVAVYVNSMLPQDITR
jgi:hypothetical protein